MFYIEIRHEELGKYRYIKGKDRFVVEQKAAAQKKQWDDMWERKQFTELSRYEKIAKQVGLQNKKEEARQRSDEAAEALKALDGILLHTIDFDDSIDWDSIKDRSYFLEPRPKEIDQVDAPVKPIESQFTPKFGLFGRIFIFVRRKKIKEAREKYEAALSAWQIQNKEIEEKNKNIRDNNYMSIRKWEERQRAFDEKRAAHNQAIDTLKEKYLSKDVNAIIEYCDIVLARSQYPDYFPQQYELEYREENKTLIIEYILPHISILPTLKDVVYIQNQDTFKESRISESQINRIYDKLIYDIILRTIHEIFESDAIQAINAVVFNGWVQFISPATGRVVTSCIVSIHTTRDEFSEIHLQLVDSKACFKALKGVGSSKLHSITPIAPVMQMDKSDKRFIDAYKVQDGLTESTNVAMMDWKDFEQLVRELFEKEFSSAGGEVRVTQSSRDGGVDAVIFDPDPIRGGKIVVQAKRYTNTVGVSSVRDLYGTVMNEGANKGILITTADYGPDAYTFAKDKPLTLLNGGHLLYLISKHGSSARINLGEAKENAKQSS
ncbi:MAG: EcoKMrr [Pseudomonadota bacterium]|jgi:restriction system protein